MRIFDGVTLVRRKPCANTKYRDAAGFCLLTNRCWAGRRCPTTAAAADRARDELVKEAAAKAGLR